MNLPLGVPVVQGVIDRRILVNFQVEPEVLARVLPPPFRPQLAGGRGIAGVCLIRLKEIRPRLVPVRCGLSSENAAHRIAVEWDGEGGPREGVYIPRRDLDYALTVGLRMLRLRHLVEEREGGFSAVEEELPLLRYYANSIDHLL